MTLTLARPEQSRGITMNRADEKTDEERMDELLGEMLTRKLKDRYEVRMIPPVRNMTEALGADLNRAGIQYRGSKQVGPQALYAIGILLCWKMKQRSAKSFLKAAAGLLDEAEELEREYYAAALLAEAARDEADGKNPAERAGQATAAQSTKSNRKAARGGARRKSS